jgi:hypothetical protein
MQLTRDTGLTIDPALSPDGTLVYGSSFRDGSRCIWAQRLNPTTKRPEGAPFDVYPDSARPYGPSSGVSARSRIARLTLPPLSDLVGAPLGR